MKTQCDRGIAANTPLEDVAKQRPSPPSIEEGIPPTCSPGTEYVTLPKVKMTGVCAGTYSTPDPAPKLCTWTVSTRGDWLTDAVAEEPAGEMNTTLWPEKANACPDRVTVKSKGAVSRTGDVKLMLRTLAEPISPIAISSEDDGTVLSGYDPEDAD
jgi:hypothetical protein